MPTIPCEHWVCACPDGSVPDWPILNLSAEAPDARVNVSRDFPVRPPPPWGGPYGSLYCGTSWVYSDESQEAADLAAAALNINCGNGGGGGGGGGDEDGGNPTPGESYGNAAQTCTFTCPDGTVQTRTTAANTVFSVVSQADANARALSLCNNQINASHLCFNDSSIPAACANSSTDYLFEFTASGGNPPYHFTADGAEVPSGMTLFASSLSGWPSTPGVYPITVYCTDDSVPPMVTSKLFTLYVLEVTTTSLPNGNTGIAYSQALSGDPPGTGFWSIVSGALPIGMVLNPVTGVISGTPDTVGLFNFVVGLTIP